MSSSPNCRQPIAASQVRARTTGGAGGTGPTGCRHPSKYIADEQGSSPRSPSQCLERFLNT